MVRRETRALSSQCVRASQSIRTTVSGCRGDSALVQAAESRGRVHRHPEVSPTKDLDQIRGLSHLISITFATQ